MREKGFRESLARAAKRMMGTEFPLPEHLPPSELEKIKAISILLWSARAKKPLGAVQEAEIEEGDKVKAWHILQAWRRIPQDVSTRKIIAELEARYGVGKYPSDEEVRPIADKIWRKRQQRRREGELVPQFSDHDIVDWIEAQGELVAKEILKRRNL